MRETALSSSGGAVCLSRGALRVLDRLGLGSRIRATGQPATTAEVYSRRGKRLFHFDMGRDEVYAVPRPRLRQAFVAAMPPDAVFFATAFKGMHLNHDHVAAQLGEAAEPEAGDFSAPDAPESVDRPVHVMLRDLSAPPREQDYGVLANKVIGADGGRSAVRPYITQPGASRSTGFTVYRAAVKNSDHAVYPPNTIREVWGERNAGRPSLRFGFCRMTPTNVYWWATVDTASLARSGGADDIMLRPFGRKLADQFENFPFAISRLVESTAESEIDHTAIRTFAMRDNPWVDMSGRVVLTGDAARQSDLPYLHHASSMAIEDGYALAGAVDGAIRAKGSRRPLDAYELERREETQAMHRAWEVFDRLAGSRNRVERFWNSQLLKITVARQMLQGSGNEKRDMRMLSNGNR